MFRLPEAILKDQAYARGRKVPMVDTRFGGQNGYAPNLAEWVSSTDYVSKNLVCLLIEAPKGFQLMPEPTFRVAALKAMVESHAKTIEGLNAGLTVDFADTPVGGAGEQFSNATNVTRAQSNITFTFTDRYGRPFQNFLHDWITYLIQDPDAKVPMISTLGVDNDDMLNDISAATMLFYEPDPTHKKVDKAWLTTNMMPKGTGDIVGKRDLTSAGTLSELSIEFTGVSQTGLGVVSFAQTLVDRINLQNANPYLRNAFATDYSPQVAAAGTIGYEAGAETLGTQSIRL